MSKILQQSLFMMLIGALLFVLLGRECSRSSTGAKQTSSHGEIVDKRASSVPAATASGRAHISSRSGDVVDARHGWEWSDRCWKSIQLGALAKARNECNKGISLPADSPNPMASLLYNLGLINEREGDAAAAADSFRRSLLLRENREVRSALERVEPH